MEGHMESGWPNFEIRNWHWQDQGSLSNDPFPRNTSIPELSTGQSNQSKRSGHTSSSKKATKCFTSSFEPIHWNIWKKGYPVALARHPNSQYLYLAYRTQRGHFNYLLFSFLGGEIYDDATVYIRAPLQLKKEHENTRVRSAIWETSSEAHRTNVAT